MAVFRVNKSKDYTCMSNVHLRDKRMTLKAKGLLSVMLSLPDDWDYTMDGLVWLNKESAGAIKAALGELKKYGYLTVTKYQNKVSGLFEYRYDIYENPDTKNPAMENPAVENPYVDNPAVENHMVNKVLTKTNTDKRNTEKASTKTNKGGFPVFSDNPKLQETIKAFAEFRKASKKPMTEHAVELLVVKLDKMAKTDDEKIAILEQSMVNGWTGVYEIKNKTNERERAFNEMDRSFMNGTVV